MNNKFYIGIIFYVLSYLQFSLPEASMLLGLADSWFTANAKIFYVFHALFSFGIIFISDGITMEIYGKSLLNEIFKNRTNTFRFIVISAIGGMGLDAIAQWLNKLWIYPYAHLDSYFHAFITVFILYVLEFSLYWLMIVESYLATKAIIDYLRKGKKIVKNYFKFEPNLYKALGLIGIILIPVSAFLMIRIYSLRGGYVFDLANPVSYEVNLFYVILIFFGVWFFLEYLQYSWKKTSLLKDILHDYFSPILAIFTASYVLALIMETHNLFAGLWLYTNWPLEHIRLLSLPLTMFLAWPLQYVLFLSFFRAFTDKGSDEIWKGDLIK